MRRKGEHIRFAENEMGPYLRMLSALDTLGNVTKPGKAAYLEALRASTPADVRDAIWLAVQERRRAERVRK